MSRREKAGRPRHGMRIMPVTILAVILTLALFGSVLFMHGRIVHSRTAASTTADNHSARRRVTVPTDVHVTAVHPTAVYLAWQPGTSGAMAAHYVIYRDGVRIGSSKSLRFGDHQARPTTTYSYQITAAGTSGRVSPPSKPAVITTPASGSSSASPSPSATAAPSSPPASTSPSPPSGFPDASTTGYLNAPGYPGQLTNCSDDIQSNTTYRYCDFPNGLAIGSAQSHPTNVTFIGCRFASNATDDADVADYGSNIVFAYSTFEPSTVAAGPGPASPAAAPIANSQGYQYGIDQRYTGALTVENGDFWGFAQAIEFGFSSRSQPLTVSDSWIHNPRADGGTDHTDGILDSYGGVGYMVFNHNSIIGDGNTNGLALQGNSPYNHVTITNNYFSGYGYTVNSGQNTLSSDMVFTGNVWGADIKPNFGPLYGGAMYDTPGLGGAWSNNKIEVPAGTTWMAAGNNDLYWWPGDGLPSNANQIIGHHQDFPGA
jgi:hypothetical protein